VPASGGSDASGVRGKDVCACNQLLDGLARVRLGRRFDENGAVAATGKVIPKALAALEQIIQRQATSGRSLGTGDELASWISTTAAQPGADVVRTACEAIARAVADAVER
ncbi:anhydro-N-acetylmuramic acid kinase, partial [bacterium]|nr:anhydro-N-acetylmuramic acid kinase [bacterium]